MRRLLRWAFNFTTLISALLFVGVCVLWVRGYRVGDSWSWKQARGLGQLTSRRGVMEYTEVHFEPETWEMLSPQGRDLEARGQQFGYHAEPAPAPGGGSTSSVPPEWSAAGFEWKDVSVMGLRLRELDIPDWSLALILATLPLPRLVIAVKRRRRSQPGCCPKCGYDLRATPDRCPECGAAPKG